MIIKQILIIVLLMQLFGNSFQYYMRPYSPPTILGGSRYETRLACKCAPNRPGSFNYYKVIYNAYDRSGYLIRSYWRKAYYNSRRATIICRHRPNYYKIKFWCLVGRGMDISPRSPPMVIYSRRRMQAKSRRRSFLKAPSSPPTILEGPPGATRVRCKCAPNKPGSFSYYLFAYDIYDSDGTVTHKRKKSVYNSEKCTENLLHKTDYTKIIFWCQVGKVGRLSPKSPSTVQRKAANARFSRREKPEIVGEPEYVRYVKKSRRSYLMAPSSPPTILGGPPGATRVRCKCAPNEPGSFSYYLFAYDVYDSDGTITHMKKKSFYNSETCAETLVHKTDFTKIIFWCQVGKSGMVSPKSPSTVLRKPADSRFNHDEKRQIFGEPEYVRDPKVFYLVSQIQQFMALLQNIRPD